MHNALKWENEAMKAKKVEYQEFHVGHNVKVGFALNEDEEGEYYEVRFKAYPESLMISMTADVLKDLVEKGRKLLDDETEVLSYGGKQYMVECIPDLAHFSVFFT